MSGRYDDRSPSSVLQHTGSPQVPSHHADRNGACARVVHAYCAGLSQSASDAAAQRSHGLRSARRGSLARAHRRFLRRRIGRQFDLGRERSRGGAPRWLRGRSIGQPGQQSHAVLVAQRSAHPRPLAAACAERSVPRTLAHGPLSGGLSAVGGASRNGRRQRASRQAGSAVRGWSPALQPIARNAPQQIPHDRPDRAGSARERGGIGGGGRGPGVVAVRARATVGSDSQLGAGRCRAPFRVPGQAGGTASSLGRWLGARVPPVWPQWGPIDSSGRVRDQPGRNCRPTTGRGARNGHAEPWATGCRSTTGIS